MQNKYNTKMCGWIYFKAPPNQEVTYGARNISPQSAKIIIPALQDILNKLHIFTNSPTANNVVSIRRSMEKVGGINV